MDITERGIALQRDIEADPKMMTYVRLIRSAGAETIVLHQDAFAADYQAEEFVLLGKAIKYAGLFGRSIQIHGQNRESLKPPG